MSGKLKASMEPSSLTAASERRWAGAGQEGQDQVVCSAAPFGVALGRYDGQAGSEAAGA